MTRTITRQLAAIVVVALCASCAFVRANRPAECASGETPMPSILDSAQLAQLVGRYDVAVVTTAEGHPKIVRRGLLTLAENDTLSRYYRRFLTRTVRGGNRVLAGTLEFEGQRPDTVTVDSAGLTLGACQFAYCSDAPVSRFRITRRASVGYGGDWLRDEWATNFVPIDKSGRFLPNPGGYFCIRRR